MGSFRTTTSNLVPSNGPYLDGRGHYVSCSELGVHLDEIVASSTLVVFDLVKDVVILLEVHLVVDVEFEDARGLVSLCSHGGD